MNSTKSGRLIRSVQGWALIAFPAILMLVFALHFREWNDFFAFRWRYEPRQPDIVVRALIAGANRTPLIHDPHVIAYLALPLLYLCAFGLYNLGRVARPVGAAIGLSLTLIGTLYTGGLFGMWTAFYRGLGNVESRHVEGATAAFVGMTAPGGAFLLTTTLAKLAMLGLGVQTQVLWGTRIAPPWALVASATGCALFLMFWDQDNWMLIGAALLCIGFMRMRSRLLR